MLTWIRGSSGTFLFLLSSLCDTWLWPFSPGSEHGFLSTILDGLVVWKFAHHHFFVPFHN